MLHFKEKNILETKGIQLTKKRLSVLNAFLYFQKPINLKTIREHIGGMDRVTLFRILSLFESKNIIHKITLDSGLIYYAICKEKCSSDSKCAHTHVHFLCNVCEDVSCLEIEDFPVLQHSGFSINNLSINASGTCNNCSK